MFCATLVILMTFMRFNQIGMVPEQSSSAVTELVWTNVEKSMILSFVISNQQD